MLCYNCSIPYVTLEGKDVHKPHHDFTPEHTGMCAYGKADLETYFQQQATLVQVLL